jgi:tRNA threonylcarbamoyladenosine biosynthesis protein TsaE
MGLRGKGLLEPQMNADERRRGKGVQVFRCSGVQDEAGTAPPSDVVLPEHPNTRTPERPSLSHLRLSAFICGSQYAGEPLKLRVETEAEMRALGERIGAELQSGDVVCLSGPLGAGKTTLAQGIAAGLGVTEPVSSPTFTLVQAYAGRVPVYHLDVYRLRSLDELWDLSFDDLRAAPGVMLIEWPERIAPALPPDRLEIEIAPAGDARDVTVQGYGRLRVEGDPGCIGRDG